LCPSPRTKEQQNKAQSLEIARLRLDFDREKVQRQDLETRMTRVEAILDIKLTNLTAMLETQSERVDRIWDVLREERRKNR